MPLASASASAARLMSSGSSAAVGLLLGQPGEGFGHLELAALARGLPHLAHDRFQVDHLRAHAGDFERHRRGFVDLDLDLGGGEAAVGEALLEAVAGGGARTLAGQRVEQPLHRRFLGRRADRIAAALALQPDRFLDQVAADLLDVAADIADLGELGRLDLDERRVGQLRQPPADLGLAAAGGADHQDVLGRHFLAKLGAQLLAPPAVAKRDRDRALGVVLADDMLVERGDDRLGGQRVLGGAIGQWRLIIHRLD